MQCAEILKSVLLMLVLLNPFLMSLYLIDLIKELTLSTFSRVLTRAFIISGTAFSLLAVMGDALFTSVLQVRFESFLIFGGIIFLLIAIRFIVLGVPVLTTLRGEPEYLAGSIAMPFLIGPGTVSASIVIGTKLPTAPAILAILLGIVISCFLLIILKFGYDFMKKQNERVIERYVEIIGRVSALIIGTLALEMILTGLERWWSKIP